MTRLAGSRRLAWLHPVLVAVFPVLFVYSRSLDEVEAREIVVPLAVAVGLAVASTAVLAAIFQSVPKGALAASLALFLFASYGHVLTFLRGATDSGLPWDVYLRFRHLLAAYALIFVLGLLLIWRVRSDLAKPTIIVTAVAAFLLANPIVTAGWGAIEAASLRAGAGDGGDANAAAPDIYYFVLDEYGRADILEEYYGFNNSAFLGELSGMGFQVLEESHSNYALTFLSLSSSLNMRHVTDLAAVKGDDSRNQLIAKRMIQHNELVRVLREEHGYRFVNFNSGASLTDHFATADRNIPCGRFSEFQDALLRTTALLPVMSEMESRFRRELIECTFEELLQLPEDEGPTFYLVHILLPHYPYVFGPEGGDAVAETTAGRYVDQLRYTNMQMERVIRHILAREPIAPIVVLQSDHGVDIEDNFGVTNESEWGRARLSNFMAFYLPGATEGAIYPGLTPVNTFRVILNEYFGAQLPLEEDRIYLSRYDAPYRLQDVTAELTGIEP